MRLHLTIEYITHWGEEIRVCGSIPELGGGAEEKAVPLHTADGKTWTLQLEFDSPGRTLIEYRYLVFRNAELFPKKSRHFPEKAEALPHKKARRKNGSYVFRREWADYPRRIHLRHSPNRTYRCIDHWRDVPEERIFFSGLFTSGPTKHVPSFPVMRTYGKSLLLKAFAPRVKEELYVGVLGNSPALGGWDPKKVLPMNDADYPEWRIELDASRFQYPIEYKFVVCDPRSRRVIAWEEGPNRRLDNPKIQVGESAIIDDAIPHFPLPVWKGAGVAVPVFSLRSADSFGIGDFADLHLLIEWAAKTRQKVVQLLPIADTTMTHSWLDSYPYNSISIYALHPIYLAPFRMGVLDDGEKQTYYEGLQKQLNALPQMDYEAVEHAKWGYFKLLYRQDKDKTLESKGFKHFYAENKAWLVPYATFCYFRDLYSTADFRTWPRMSRYDRQEAERLCQPGSAEYDGIALHFFLQYHLQRQLAEATLHARHEGIALKGDIPIGISRNSVEAWKEPEYFHMDSQTGAPPDDFSIYGQNWGFPCYNWERMEENDYQWWKQRFQKMAEFFDLYRIDHLLGFFRIWEIPLHSERGLLGQFSPALPLSQEEIEACGLPFRRERLLQPFIPEAFLDELFGPHAGFIKNNYLLPLPQPGQYRIRPEFDTQQKVRIHFESQDGGETASRLRDGLYTLLENVLFIEDRRQPGRYHPRVYARKSCTYRYLKPEEQAAFDRIHDDFYYHHHNDFWYKSGMSKLPTLVQATKMLPCGEDLGMIPACVPQTMKELRILSLEIQRMPKNWEEFGRPEHYPYHSVSSISTHDMSTLRGWWKEDPGQTQRYYRDILGHPGEAPADMPCNLCEEVIRQHLQGNSMLCILSLQDWLSMSDLRAKDTDSERINVPSNPHHYWRYRMHLTLEELLATDDFNLRIRELISVAGRNPQL